MHTLSKICTTGRQPVVCTDSINMMKYMSQRVDVFALHLITCYVFFHEGM